MNHLLSPQTSILSYYIYFVGFGEHAHGTVSLWKSEDNLGESVRPFYPGGPGVKPKIVGLGDKCLCPLTSPASRTSPERRNLTYRKVLAPLFSCQQTFWFSLENNRL